MYYKDDDASEHITHLGCAQRFEELDEYFQQDDQDEMDKAQLKGLTEH